MYSDATTIKYQPPGKQPGGIKYEKCGGGGGITLDLESKEDNSGQHTYRTKTRKNGFTEVNK